MPCLRILVHILSLPFRNFAYLNLYTCWRSGNTFFARTPVTRMTSKRFRPPTRCAANCADTAALVPCRLQHCNIGRKNNARLTRLRVLQRRGVVRLMGRSEHTMDNMISAE